MDYWDEWNEQWRKVLGMMEGSLQFELASSQGRKNDLPDVHSQCSTCICVALAYLSTLASVRLHVYNN